MLGQSDLRSPQATRGRAPRAPKRPEPALELFAGQAELVCPSAPPTGGWSHLKHAADIEHDTVDRHTRIVTETGGQDKTRHP